MKYLSVCSGIEAATAAWHPLGWAPVAFSEIEPFPSAVLAHHYPTVPNLGDMAKFQEWNIGPIDVLVGGTPCQSFSVAGLRKGFADPRGNLALVYCGILDRFKPRWFVWENVPGVLSSGGGRDFGAFLGAVAELGYGWAYRVLDAQYFGVAQRRRRVFVVGCLRDWAAAAKVLFEPESLSGNPAPRRKSREEIAGCSLPSVAGSIDTECRGGKLTHQSAANGHLISQPYPVANCLTAKMHKGINSTLDEGQMPVVAFPANLSGTQHATTENLAPAMGAKNPTAVAFDTTQITSPSNYSNPKPGDPCHPLAAGAHPPAIATTMQVRRLTPVECERLQGFPDNYTDIKPKGKPTPDGPRYKALGNSMAVPVMAWIGRRIVRYI